MKSKSILFAVIVAFCATAASAGVIWDAVADFATPNSGWSYGYGEGAVWGGAFDYALASDFPDSGGWTRSMGGAPDYSPYLFCNYSDVDVYDGTYPAHSLAMSSGTGGGDYHTIVRWTAPAAGTYQVDAVFEMLKSNGSYWQGEMDIYTAVKGEVVYSDVVSGFDYQSQYWQWPAYQPGPKTFTGTYTLNAGDTVDFVGGIGWVNAGSDFVNIAGTTITEVPEPSTIVALLCGLGCLGILRIRRK